MGILFELCQKIYSKKDNSDGIKWTTDWTNENNKLSDDNSITSKGTVFDIQYSRDAWNIKQARILADYLGRTYFDNSMEIQLSFCEEQIPIDENTYPNEIHVH